MKIRTILGASILLFVSVQVNAASTFSEIWVGTDGTSNGTINRYDTASNFLGSFNNNVGVDAISYVSVSPVPVPAAIWLFGTALIGMVGFSKRRAAL